MSEEPIHDQSPEHYVPLKQSSFIDHFAELRTRLMWCIVVLIGLSTAAYFYVEDIYGFLVKPLADAMGPHDSQRLIYTNLTEAFFTYMKVSVFVGAFLTFPFFLLQVWRFIAPGLYDNERKTVWPFLAAVPVLFFLGGALVYYVVLPLAWGGNYHLGAIPIYPAWPIPMTR